MSNSVENLAGMKNILVGKYQSKIKVKSKCIDMMHVTAATEYESDLHSNKHYLCNSKNNTWPEWKLNQ